MKFELVSYLGGARCLPAVWVIVKLSVKFAVRPFFGESRFESHPFDPMFDTSTLASLDVLVQK